MPVEYAIEMARFDERQTLDHLAESGDPDRDLVSAIADAIAASHAVAAIGADRRLGQIDPDLRRG